MEQKIFIKEYKEDFHIETVQMITDFFNYHRKLTSDQERFLVTNEESKRTLKDWLKENSIYIMFYNNKIAGFFCVRFGGDSAAWLEDIFIKKEIRGKGIGKFAMNKLDELMKEKGILAMFVDVIPRNTSAIEFYRDSGFNHLNMIQLRKNYDESLNKDDEIDVLGYKFKKY